MPRARTPFSLTAQSNQAALSTGKLFFRSGITIDLLVLGNKVESEDDRKALEPAHTRRFNRAHVRVLIGRTSSTVNLLSRIPCQRMLRQSATVHEYAHGLKSTI